MAAEACRMPNPSLQLCNPPSLRIERLCHGHTARAPRPGIPRAGDDLIEKAFQALFGQKAREDRQPLGLKRLEGTALQAQYEANTEDRAEPVEGDDLDMRIVRPLLAGTVLENAALQ